ncbi:MAG: LysM peptidoglycan-binding domain-containing protein [Actinobacteria bacterium]|nr:LysM peptidoglycan-binding domain-containing protein [Actinomycetota bacterium]
MHKRAVKVSRSAPSVYRRRRIAVAVLFSMFVLIPASVLGVLGPTSRAAGSQREVVYIVRPGDTLWSIATHVVHGGDPRPMVARLEREVDGNVIHPGQRIRIPGTG